MPHTFLRAALGCPCACRKYFCREEGEGRWNQVPSPSPVSSYHIVSPGWSSCAGHQAHWEPEFWELDWWCWARNLQSTAPKSGRMVTILGSRTRNGMDWKKTTPSLSPNMPTLFSLLWHLSLHPHNAPCPPWDPHWWDSRANLLVFHSKGFP